jgi:ribosome-binding factor A
MPSQVRLKRIGDRIQIELSEILIKDVSDPRLEGISITDVVVDREIAYANIYVSAIEGKTRSEEILAGLNHANSYLRHLLASKIELRVFPKLRFYWDPTPERADHIERLLSTLRHTENQPDNVRNDE